MFREMRAALNIPKSVDILEHIRSLSLEPDSEDALSSPRSRAVEVIQNIERSAMIVQTPQPGLTELMRYLDQRKVRKALCTRNFQLPVMHLLGRFLPGVIFEPIITREAKGIQPKPSPEGLWKIAQHWGLAEEAELAGREVFDPLLLARKHLGSGLIMVGDSADDMAAGRRAGAATVLLLNEDNEHVVGKENPDEVIGRLDDLIEILERGFVGRD